MVEVVGLGGQIGAVNPAYRCGMLVAKSPPTFRSTQTAGDFGFYGSFVVSDCELH